MKKLLAKLLYSIFIATVLQSCIMFSPEKNLIVDNSNLNLKTGIRITIDEKPRALGSNTTTVEIYSIPKSSLMNSKLLQKHQFSWYSINDIDIRNGEYKLITYYHYMGKNRVRTENIISVNNNMTNIHIKYPLFITGKARLKVY